MTAKSDCIQNPAYPLTPPDNDCANGSGWVINGKWHCSNHWSVSSISFPGDRSGEYVAVEVADELAEMILRARNPPGYAWGRVAGAMEEKALDYLEQRGKVERKIEPGGPSGLFRWLNLEAGEGEK